MIALFSRSFYDRRMGQELDGEVLGDEYKGYIFRITGGNDKKLRYWDFTNLKKKSYCINSPGDDEQMYFEEHQGETVVV